MIRTLIAVVVFLCSSIAVAQRVPEAANDAAVRHKEIRNLLWKELFHESEPVTRTPDWKKLIAPLTDRYGERDTKRSVSQVQLAFYRKLGDWPEVVDIFDKRIRQYPPQPIGTASVDGGVDSLELNDTARAIFERCEDRNVLRKALQWTALAIRIQDTTRDVVGFLDIRANLLYKLGRVGEAIATEERAMTRESSFAEQTGVEHPIRVKGLTATLAKMNSGEPTWQ